MSQRPRSNSYDLRYNPKPSLRALESTGMEQKDSNIFPLSVRDSSKPNPHVNNETIENATGTDIERSKYQQTDDTAITTQNSHNAGAPFTEVGNFGACAFGLLTDAPTSQMTNITTLNLPSHPTLPATTSTPSNDVLTQIMLMMQTIQLQNEEIKSEIKSENEKIKSEIKSENEKIKTEMKSQSDSLKVEIQNCQINLERQINSIRLDQDLIKSDIDQIKVVQNQQSVEIKQIRDEVQNELNVRESELRENLNQNLKRQTDNIKEIIQNTNTQTYSVLNSKIENQNKVVSEQLNNILQQNTQTIETTCIPMIETNRKLIEGQSAAITLISDTLTMQNERINSLQKSPNLTLPFGTAPIQITCQGNPVVPNEMSLPKFNGRAHNPREYLEKLQRYYKRTLSKMPSRADDSETLIETIEMSLEQHASRWFSLIKGDIKNWEDFENAFLSKYWSRDVQRGIRQRLETDKYRPGGNLSRAEYFVERVITLQSLTPPMTEDEIVVCLSEHFDELIQDARRVQNITTITEFEALLVREDIKHNKDRTRRPLNSPPSPSRQQHNNRNYNDSPQQRSYDFRSYQQNSSQNHHKYPNNGRRGYSHNSHNNQYSAREHPYQRNGNQYQSRNPNQHYNQRDKNRDYPTQEQGKLCATISTNPPGSSTSTQPSSKENLNS
jgi:hypothetical protein